MEATEITTVLGRGSSFEGKLTFEGTVRIDGHFAGEIHTEGTLILGDGAQVEAQVRAAVVVVHGQFKGDLVATEALEIHAPARVYGNVSSPSFSVEKGAIFQGTCRMEQQMDAADSPGAGAGPTPVASAAN